MISQMDDRSKRCWTLVSLLAVAALLRLILVLQNAFLDPLGPVMDAKLHHEMARAIAGGKIIHDVPFAHPPGFTYFLGAIYAVLGPAPTAAAAMQAVMGMVGLLLLYRLARRYTDFGPAALATGLAAFYGPLAFFELKLLPSSLSVFLVLLFLNALANFLEQGRHRWVITAGLLSGFLILVRPNLIFIPLLTLIWLLAKRKKGPLKPMIFYFASFVLAAIPALLHNAAAGDGSVLICSDGGLNFYLGNRQGGEVSFTRAFEGVIDPSRMHEFSARLYREEAGVPHEKQSDLEWFWIKRGFQEILADPISWTGLKLRQVKALLSEFEYGVCCSYAAERDVLRILFFFLTPFSVLAALGIAALFVRRNARYELSRFPLFIVLAGVLLSTLTFFTYSRFRNPAVPVLALLAGDALFRFIATVREKASDVTLRMAIPGTIVFLIAVLPPGDVADRQLSSGHAQVGKAFFDDRQIEEAKAAYARAIEIDPGSVKALQTLAGIVASTGDLTGAASLHTRALAIAHSDPETLTHAALFLLSTPPPYQNLDQAEELAARAMDVDPEFVMAYICMGMVKQVRGDIQESQALFKEALRRSGRARWVLKALIDWHRSRGDVNSAAELERELAGKG
jgi:4-amino-4-deoxy-L-arabinose transferase-like glycosyltransferase/Tfp pilus assembly protein PilF